MRGSARRWYLYGGVAAAVLGTWGTHALYEHFNLSAGMRRALVADTSTEVNPSRVEAVLREARAQTHTGRDAKEYGKLDRALRLAAEADLAEEQLMQAQNETAQQMKQEIHSEQLMQLMQRIYLIHHPQVSSGLGDDVSLELERRQALEEAQQRATEKARFHYLEQRLESQVLRQELRADLGLAPGQVSGR